MELNKNTPVGTVKIQDRKSPFRTVLIVSAEEYAEFGLENIKEFQAIRLVENRSTDNSLCFSWEYLN